MKKIVLITLSLVFSCSVFGSLNSENDPYVSNAEFYIELFAGVHSWNSEKNCEKVEVKSVDHFYDTTMNGYYVASVSIGTEKQSYYGSTIYNYTDVKLGNSLEEPSVFMTRVYCGDFGIDNPIDLIFKACYTRVTFQENEKGDLISFKLERAVKGPVVPYKSWETVVDCYNQ